MTVDVAILSVALTYKLEGGNLRGVMAYVLDSNVVVNEFELQSRYYVQFQKGMNYLISPVMGR